MSKTVFRYRMVRLLVVLQLQFTRVTALPQAAE